MPKKILKWIIYVSFSKKININNTSLKPFQYKSIKLIEQENNPKNIEISKISLDAQASIKVLCCSCNKNITKPCKQYFIIQST